MSSKQDSDDNARARWFAAWLLKKPSNFLHKSIADENVIPVLLCFLKGKSSTVRNGRTNFGGCCFAEDCFLIVTSLLQVSV